MNRQGTLPPAKSGTFTPASTKAQTEPEGHPLPDADLLIAATALMHVDHLITGNTSHFSRIHGLKVTNWLL